MAFERVDGTTPAGGDYSVATYIENLDSLKETEKVLAGAVIVAEYLSDGTWLAEAMVRLKSP